MHFIAFDGQLVDAMATAGMKIEVGGCLLSMLLSFSKQLFHIFQTANQEFLRSKFDSLFDHGSRQIGWIN